MCTMCHVHQSPIGPNGRQVCNASTGELLCEEKPISGHGEDDFGEIPGDQEGLWKESERENTIHVQYEGGMVSYPVKLVPYPYCSPF